MKRQKLTKSKCFNCFETKLKQALKNFFPIQSIVSVFRNTRNGAWYFHLFQSLFQFCFETTETFGLSQFYSSFSLFQFFPYIIHCFSVSKYQKWGLVFSPFSEFVSILFRNISKQLKCLDLSQFSSCFSPFQFFPYIIHCFSVLKHQKWGLVFSPFLEFVSILF